MSNLFRQPFGGCLPRVTSRVVARRALPPALRGTRRLHPELHEPPQDEPADGVGAFPPDQSVAELRVKTLYPVPPPSADEPFLFIQRHADETGAEQHVPDPLEPVVSFHAFDPLTRQHPPPNGHRRSMRSLQRRRQRSNAARHRRHRVYAPPSLQLVHLAVQQRAREPAKRVFRLRPAARRRERSLGLGSRSPRSTATTGRRLRPGVIIGLGLVRVRRPRGRPGCRLVPVKAVETARGRGGDVEGRVEVRPGEAVPAPGRARHRVRASLADLSRHRRRVVVAARFQGVRFERRRSQLLDGECRGHGDARVVPVVLRGHVGGAPRVSGVGG
mmetsp:Transcript_5605/g.22933  ORF Transcript_5605/g.22933 Transcript_5605/m.22933 type:complete len:330 (-) Transcript_5605:199-1188(-)